MKKVRLDILLYEKGCFDSREKAKATIMSGVVYVNGQKSDKPGMQIPQDADIDIRGNVLKYVSRGGLKLEKAIEQFGIVLKGKTALDVGASTGGFSDCMLKNGADKVYAIDVGYGQLAWSIRNNPKVVVMERTNIRNVKPDDIGDLADFCSIDVSFISLKLVLPVVKTLIKNTGEVVCLIKPQFEAGRESVGKKGVVRDENVHIKVVNDFLQYAYNFGFSVKNLTFSPIKGPEGNIEYLAYITAAGGENADFDVPELVRQSHMQLNKTGD